MINEIIKNGFIYNKENFDKGLNTLTNLQQKAVDKGTEFIEKFSFFPEQGKTMVNQWEEINNLGRRIIQVVADKGCQEAENFLSVRE